MTDEEIKKIAQAYGESVANSFDYDMLPNPREAYRQRLAKETKQAESMLDFLSKNYCIIPKSKARELHQIVTDNMDSLDHGLIDGLSDWVEINLGSQLFEEEKL